MLIDVYYMCNFFDINKNYENFIKKKRFVGSGKPIFLKICTVIKYNDHWKKCFLKGIKPFMRNAEKWSNIL